MEDKKQDNAQKPIIVYGMANIGCDQTGATFQTLVAAPEELKVQEAEVVEEEVKKPKATGGGRPKKSGTKISKAFIYNN